MRLILYQFFFDIHKNYLYLKMLKTNTLYMRPNIKILTLLLALIIPFSLYSQESFVRVKGNALNLMKQPIKGGAITLMLDNKKVKTVITNRKGEFSLELQHSKTYTIEATKRGYVTKKISFITKVPQKDTKGYMWEYDLNIQLFETIDGLDVSPLKDPVAAIQYMTADEDFDYDNEYTDKMNVKIKDILKQLELLKKQKYQKQIATAENLFGQKKLEESWLAYDNAQKLQPKEKDPKKKIAEIKKEIFKNTSEATAYRDLIAKADKLLGTKYLKEAASTYEIALLYRPDDKYADEKLDEIEKMINQGVPAIPVDADLTADVSKTKTSTAPDIKKSEDVTIDNILRESALQESRIKKMLDSCQNVLRIRENAGDKKGIASVLNKIAELYMNIGDFESANEYYDRTLRINQALGDKVAISKTLNNLGVVSDNASSPDKALAYFQTSLEVKKDLKDNEGMSKIYYRMAKVYQKKREFKKAIEFFEKSLVIDMELKKDKEVAASYLIIGNCYYELKKFDVAEEYYNKALSAFESLRLKKESSIALNNLGNVYYENKKFDKAIEYYNRSVSLKEVVNYKSGYALTLHNIGNIAKSKNEIDKAIGYYNKSILRAKVVNDNIVIARNYFAFNEVYSLQNNHKKALEYFKLYSSIIQIVQGADVPGQIVETMIKYEGDAISKDSELSVLKGELVKQKLYSQAIALKNEAANAEVERMETKMKQNKIILIASAAGFLIILLFSMFLLFNYKKLRKAYNVISEHEKVIERQTQEIEAQRDFVIKQGDRIASQNVKIKEQRDLAYAQNKEILDSVDYAKYIQTALLLPEDEVMAALPDHFVLFKPKKVVSGDFYWIRNVKYTDINKAKNVFVIVAADCTGPGVPGAVMSMLGVSLLNEILNKIVETQEYSLLQTDYMMNALRNKFIKSLHLKGKEGETKDGMDLAICLFDPAEQALQYTGANHPLYIVRKPTESNPEHSIEELKADKIPIGMYEEVVRTFTKNNIQLAKGDSFYIFSDGYYDQFGGPKGKKFKVKQFKELILSIQGHSLDEQKIIINQAFEEWKGDNEQVDDVLIVGMKV